MEKTWLLFRGGDQVISILAFDEPNSNPVEIYIFCCWNGCWKDAGDGHLKIQLLIETGVNADLSFWARLWSVWVASLKAINLVFERPQGMILGWQVNIDYQWPRGAETQFKVFYLFFWSELSCSSIHPSCLLKYLLVGPMHHPYTNRLWNVVSETVFQFKKSIQLYRLFTLTLFLPMARHFIIYCKCFNLL